MNPGRGGGREPPLRPPNPLLSSEPLTSKPNCLCEVLTCISNRYLKPDSWSYPLKSCSSKSKEMAIFFLSVTQDKSSRVTRDTIHSFLHIQTAMELLVPSPTDIWNPTTSHSDGYLALARANTILLLCHRVASQRFFELQLELPSSQAKVTAGASQVDSRLLPLMLFLVSKQKPVRASVRDISQLISSLRQPSIGFAFHSKSKNP